MAYLAYLRLGLALMSIAANALVGGGIFTFPIMSPALAANLKLTQPQLTSIVLAGMIGQYPASAGVGYIVDAYGPWACSLLAAILFSAGFGFFSLEISRIPEGGPSSFHDVETTFHTLVFLFLLCGLATVNSYFSSLFAATKMFPRNPGLASGISMGLFGLSPLLLTLIAGKFFKTQDEGLDVTAYTRFLAILTLVVHVIGTFTLTTRSSTVVLGRRQQVYEPEQHQGESSPLLSPPSPSPTADPKTTVTGVLHDPSFWVLALVMAMTLGSSEMVLSNIGTIVLSLPSIVNKLSTDGTTNSPVAVTAHQVRLLSFSNTASRLLVGFVADWVSPVGHIDESDGVLSTAQRKKGISRITFLMFFSFLLSITFAYTVLYVRSQDGVWPLSVGVGVGYGAVFTILPSIISAFWGLSNVGRNFGLLTYAPFLFTPAFSYLYAFLSEAHTKTPPPNNPRACYGVQCWSTTFEIAAMGTLGAAFASTLLWKWWRAKV